ncbi:MAG: ATP-binding protein [Myxococcota bacterium]
MAETDKDLPWQLIHAEVERVARLGTWVVDAEGACWWSRRTFDLLGYDPSEVTPTLDLLQAAFAEEDRNTVGSYLEATSRGQQSDPLRCRVVRSNPPREVIAEVVPVEGTRGERWLIGTLRDARAVDRAQERARLAETLQALGRLAAGVAHDFNNLLTVVLGHARVLQSERPSSDIDAIVEASESGAQLTRRLLEFARESPVKKRYVELETVVAESIGIVSSLVLDNITLAFEPANERTTVYVDAADLHRALLSLVVNAQEAMPDGGEILIHTSPRHYGEVEGVELVVTDKGTGMDLRTQHLAMEPFFTTKDLGQGNGLGLPGVFGFAQQMGGELELTSEPAVGTTVRLWLPRAMQSAVPSVAPIPAPSSRTVLVVDDELLLRRLVQRVLEHAGYSVIVAAGPDEAIELAGQHSFDALLTDLTMPGGGGRRVVRVLREKRPGLRILYMTGYAPDAAELDGPVLLKPFPPQQLLESLERLFSISR